MFLNVQVIYFQKPLDIRWGRDNSRVFEFEKNHILEKNPSSELSLIALYQNTITRNSESTSFTGLLKSLVALWVLEETRHTWPMFSELKALVDSERFRVIAFQYRAENVNSELGFFSFKRDLICKSKIPSYRFSVWGKKR